MAAQPDKKHFYLQYFTRGKLKVYFDSILKALTNCIRLIPRDYHLHFGRSRSDEVFPVMVTVFGVVGNGKLAAFLEVFNVR